MALLPTHLDRTLHALAGRASETEGAAATLDAIRALIADPPPPGQLKEWLAELEELGLVEAGSGGWHVTDDGWRAVNLKSWPPVEE